MTYIPLSMWASALNWNGLFLVEPRWRVAFIFSIAGLLLQLGLALLNQPIIASVANIIYLSALLFSLVTAEQVMHPPSPIFNSGSLRIQFFFLSLNGLTLAAAVQIAFWWHQLDSTKANSSS